MPKANSPSLPLNGLFPIAKPSGPSSMRVIDQITPLLLDSRLFDDPTRTKAPEKGKRKRNLTHEGLKIGQGGTLDPLADGVLVIGVNRGTKHLNQFLECTKSYTSIGLLGAATTTMDSEGAVLTTGNFDNVTREDIEKVLDQFRGDIMQTPPIFSALKMDGKPLYDYARQGIPLPRAIPSRKCTVSIDLIDYKPASTTPDDGGHNYTWPSKRLDPEEKAVFRRLTDLVQQASKTETDGVKPPVPDLDQVEVPEFSEKTGLRPATFKVRMTVSSGTYVRSIVHDMGLALGCGAHVVELTRTRQGDFVLQGDEEILAEKQAEGVKEEMDEEEAAANGLNVPGPSTGAIPWSVWERALAEREQAFAAERQGKADAIAEGASEEEIDMEFGRDAIWKKRRTGELKEWENELLRRFVSVHVPPTGSHEHTRRGGPSYR